MFQQYAEPALPLAANHTIPYLGSVGGMALVPWVQESWPWWQDGRRWFCPHQLHPPGRSVDHVLHLGSRIEITLVIGE